MTNPQMCPQSAYGFLASITIFCLLLPPLHQRIPLTAPPLIKLRWPALCLVISWALRSSVSEPALLLRSSRRVYAKKPLETQADLISVNVTGLRDKCREQLLQ